jgi:hypothetical protein
MRGFTYLGVSSMLTMRFLRDMHARGAVSARQTARLSSDISETAT